jgi:glycosyltransferase involved in cell wall biosynthesis
VRILFIPSWAENPYPTLLAQHLEARGLEVLHAGWKRIHHPFRIGRQGVDVVHLHSAARLFRTPSPVRAAGRALWALASLAVLRARGVKIVWTVHDLQDHDRLHPRIDAAFTWVLARLAHAIITHGETARRLLRNRMRLRTEERLAVIPHGPFTHYAQPGLDRAAARARLGLRDDLFVYLFLGAVREYKGVEDLIRAFKRLDEPAARLLVRGRTRDPALRERIRAEASGDPRIDFVDAFVADGEIALFFAACDVAVAPYRRVLTSGSVALATSLDRPCIAPHLGGVPDALDEFCGWLYEPWDDEGLTGALADAFARRSELAEMGRRAGERIRQTGWPAIAEMTESVYRR